MDEPREPLERHWLHLTREVMPPLAGPRGWPITHDHCFQRVLLDHAVGGPWFNHVAGRPAYRHIDRPVLARAVALAEAVVAGDADLAALNAQSLRWRGTRRPLLDKPEANREKGA